MSNKLSKDQWIKMVKSELERIREKSDVMLYGVGHDKDFPTKMDITDSIHLETYVSNLKMLLIAEKKMIKA
jgi:hypothetical protein